MPDAARGLPPRRSTETANGSSWPTDLLTWIVRENELMSLEEMHHSFAALPCSVFGLEDRGVLKEGAFADLVVYKLEDLHFDRSGYEVAHDMAGGDGRRKVKAGGYRWIIVNGVVTFENDIRRGSVPGRLLRGGRSEAAQPLRSAAE
jgi:N-acyl-D-aspartate/D-glutamate deacylase